MKGEVVEDRRAIGVGEPHRFEPDVTFRVEEVDGILVGRGLTELERAEKKLANPGFVAKAAADVVAGERAKAAGLRDELERMRRALDELA